MAQSDMLYFSSVEGRVVARPGTDSFIGCKKEINRNTQGVVVSRKWKWDTDRVVAIPKNEALANLKTFDRAVKRGDLVVRTAADFEAQQSGAEPSAKKPSKRKGGRKPADLPAGLDETASEGAGGDGEAEG